jgi:RNA polymerase sigma-70 factor, ECF subfamily
MATRITCGSIRAEGSDKLGSEVTDFIWCREDAELVTLCRVFDSTHHERSFRGSISARGAIRECVRPSEVHLGFCASAGARDPEALAAEVMAIAWRKLADLPEDDPRPWLIATARYLILAERRRGGPVAVDIDEIERSGREVRPLRLDLDPGLEGALLGLSEKDREALLLVAWEDLTPSLAAASLGISAAAFRVRLHRARRRLISALQEPEHVPKSVEFPPTRLEQP